MNNNTIQLNSKCYALLEKIRNEIRQKTDQLSDSDIIFAALTSLSVIREMGKLDELDM